ncbi:MAG: site-specific integrase [Candidatus Elarobacter sp.]
MSDSRLKRRGTRWSAVVWVTDQDGRRRQQRLSYDGRTHTKREAEKAFVADLAAVDAGSFVRPTSQTVREHFADWIAAAKDYYAGSTWERYELIVRVHINPALGNYRLQDLKAVHLTKAYSAWRSQGLSGQTVLHHHRLLHRILGQALREGVVTENAATFAQRPKVQRREMRMLTPSEIQRLLKHAGDLEPLIILALSSGARRGELLGAKWENFDSKRRTLAIQRSLEQTRNGVVEKAPKNGKARVVTLPKGAVEILLQRRREQGRIAGYIFAASDGGPEAPHRISDRFRALSRRARISGITFHSLRHTCASLLLAQGVHPKVVQEMLGHSSIAITMDLYSHTTPSLQAEAASKLDDVLKAAIGAGSLFSRAV